MLDHVFLYEIRRQGVLLLSVVESPLEELGTLGMI